MVVLDQRSYLEKLSPPGREFITCSSLNLLPGFKVEGEHREDLLKLPG